MDLPSCFSFVFEPMLSDAEYQHDILLSEPMALTIKYRVGIHHLKVSIHDSTSLCRLLTKSILTLSQTSPCFYVLHNQSFENTEGKREISHFPTAFSTLL